jgi:hypothetical protein
MRRSALVLRSAKEESLEKFRPTETEKSYLNLEQGALEINLRTFCHSQYEEIYLVI